MKVHILLFFVSLTSASYHKDIGIPAAQRIKQNEIAHNNTRIINGYLAGVGEYPYFAGLLISLDNEYLTSICGSSLITNTKLVTAGHCADDGVDQAQSFQVVLGSTKLFSGGKRINTNKVKIHEEYDPESVRNDIAIITIPKVNYNSNIQPISVAEDLSNRYVDVSSIVVGFGVTNDNSNIETNQQLSYVEVKVKSDNYCNVYGSLFTTSTICTEGSRGSPCRGDSGGPLVYRSEGHVLIGIVSFGSVYCTAGYPAVYTRITSYIDWINKNT